MNIKFSEEWDKLKEDRRKVGEYFTTARGYTPSKELYYLAMEGQTIDIMLKEKWIGEAKVIRTEVSRLDDMDLFWWQMDTKKEYGWKEVKELMFKFYRNTNPILIVIYMQWVEV